MKNRYNALGVPKTPVFILQTTKIRPRKPRKHVAREMMSRNAGLRTRGCNVSTEHSPSLKDSAASGVPQANTIRNDFIAVCETSSPDRGLRRPAQALERQAQSVSVWIRTETRVSAAR